jgi:undecaprenyl-diphosphatase
MGAIMDALLTLPPLLVLFFAFALPAAEASVMVGMVIPGETAVIVAGVVAHEGNLPLWAVITAAAAGALIGDQIGFRVGRRLGPHLIDRLPARVRNSGNVERVLEFVERRGMLAVILGRWTAMLRAMVPGICGMSGMRQPVFTVGNVIGGIVWAVICSVAVMIYRHLRYPAGRPVTVTEDRSD